MKILVIGSGAREHAITWKLAQSQKVSQLLVAPGNAGTAQIATNINIPVSDSDGLVKIAQDNNIDLVVVGPEQPLAEGLVDRFQQEEFATFGPTQKAARLEASKVFAKELMQNRNIPCATSASFTDYDEAVTYIKNTPPPLVIKADGLAAGKGVIIADNTNSALAALDTIMLEKAFGNAGNSVVIEEYLSGREVSALAFSDGKTVSPMVPACDYKPAFDGNKGPNTGGMGSFSPPAFYSEKQAQAVYREIMLPTVNAMAEQASPFSGVLYFGLMVNGEESKVLEYNARFGDPETQVILPRLKTDLADIMLAVANGELAKQRIEWYPQPCVCVVIASGGYPGKYLKGLPINGLKDVDKDVMVFHAGTKIDEHSGSVVSNGGRVLSVVALAKTITAAREKAYDNVNRIHFEGCYYRSDIALNE